MRKIATHKFFDFYIKKAWLSESFLLRYLFWVIGGQLIENQLLLRQIYKEPLIISYKPGRSLKDILVKDKLWELKAILKRVGGKREVRLLFIMWYVAIYRAIIFSFIARQLGKKNVMSLTGHRTKHFSGLHKQIKATIKHTHFDQISEQ